MFVRDYMTRHPLMAEPSMSIVEAQRYMGENNIRHLPIVGDGKRLLGLVTRQTLLVDPGRLGSLDVWEITRFLSRLTVRDIMIKARDVITISQDATIEEAARFMITKRIGCLPVLNEGILIGVITEMDLLAQLTNLLGGTVSGVRVTMRVPDRVGEFAKVTSAIASQGWGIYASGEVPAPKDPGYWHFVIKVRHVSKEEMIAVLERIEDQQIIDVREVHER
jgi:acetoin utilization protein AcuB